VSSQVQVIYVNYCNHYTVCTCCTGERLFEVKIEADSNDITERLHDDKPRPYLCTVCSKRFAVKDSLTKHKEIHNGGKLYPCTECEKCFPTQRYLRQHMNVHSSKYKCTECGKCFRSTSKLTIHMEGHSGEKPYICYECGKTFRNFQYLQRHLRVHTGAKPHSCRHCSACFAQIGPLKEHLLKSHNEGTWFTCHICEKKFSRSDSLKLHFRSHKN